MRAPLGTARFLASLCQHGLSTGQFGTTSIFDRVLTSTSATGLATCTFFQPRTAVAHPTRYPGGHADHKGVGRHVFSDYCACRNECILSDRDAANDGAVRADAGAFLNPRCFVFVPADDVAARVHHVGEYHGRSAEHVVLENRSEEHTSELQTQSNLV